MQLKEVSNFDYEIRTPEYPERSQLETLTKTTTINFLEDLYTYPPKFTVKWDAVDELNGDLFLDNNYGVLEHSIPFIDFVEDWFFNDFSVEEKLTESYPRSAYLEGFLNKLNTSDFYSKKSESIQKALSAIPVYVIMNGYGEIILNQPPALIGSNTIFSYLNKILYKNCGAFDQTVSGKDKSGFFFFSRENAEIYLQEIAKTDVIGTKTLGLSLHCIGLDSAYKITRENHPGIDFRFVPNLSEVKNLLQNEIGTSDSVVEDNQQQLRFRRRTVNMFPSWGKLGKLLSASSSFLQRNEYFKGVPVYIVQISDTPKSLLHVSYYTALGLVDTAYSRCIQFLDYTIGFGHNWIMQGSLRDKKNSASLTNYVFFDKKEAKRFFRKQGNKVARYKGSRTSNLEFLIRKPKMYIYNLEDLIEYWEDTLQEKLTSNLSGNNNNIFDAKDTYFIPPQINKAEDIYIQKLDQPGMLKTVKQNLNVKFRVLKQFVGIFFSVN